jgi:NAD(P)-dependent dehydrogenase (short-subunit alcohol dehydrogenase family)
MAVNVRGVFLTVREGARRLMAIDPAQRRDGRIVIISSITAQSVSPGLAVYSASKAAVLQLGRVLARDWANKGINLNILCPGYIETDLNADWFHGAGGARQIAGWPRRRLMDTDALDAMLAYLCSDASRFVTGSVFTIDDGQTL